MKETGKDNGADRKDTKNAGRKEGKRTGGFPIEQGAGADSGSAVPLPAEPNKPPGVTGDEG